MCNQTCEKLKAFHRQIFGSSKFPQNSVIRNHIKNITYLSIVFVFGDTEGFWKISTIFNVQHPVSSLCFKDTVVNIHKWFLLYFFLQICKKNSIMGGKRGKIDQKFPQSSQISSDSVCTSGSFLMSVRNMCCTLTTHSWSTELIKSN